MASASNVAPTINLKIYRGTDEVLIYDFPPEFPDISSLTFIAKLYDPAKPKNITYLSTEVLTEKRLKVIFPPEITLVYPVDEAKWGLIVDLPGIPASNLGQGKVKFEGAKA